MKKWVVRFVAFFLQVILRLRYRIRIVGLESVIREVESHPDGVLFLPNHPAVLVDPLMIACPIMKLGLRPMMTEYMYFNPLFYPLMRAIRALPVPNFASSVNPIKIHRIDKVLEEMSAGLKKGEVFLIYPSGTTKHTGREIIGGAFGTFHLLQQNPKAKVVLVRLSGLWGSRFSRAQWEGNTVSMMKGIRESFKDLLKNLIFFTPRRQITLEYVLAPQDFPRFADKLTLNRWLENWYNKPYENCPGKCEPVKLVSYSAWREDVPQIRPVEREEEEAALIPDDIREEVLAKVSEISHLPVDQILASHGLVETLGIDSLNLAELVTYLEMRFGVEKISPQELTTVGRLFEIANHTYKKAEEPEPTWKLKGWDKERKKERLLLPDGQTVPETFFKTCDRLLGSVACADARSGTLTYRRMKRAVLLLAKAFEKLPGKRVGVLLPSSVGAELIILACHVAGKTPVMINWTVGGRHLNSVIEVSGIQKVITSWAFLDNLENADVGAIKDMMAVLEEVKVQIPFSDVMLTWFMSFMPSRLLMKTKRMEHVRALKPEDEAVVLFTSGTESIPKGVPLSHYNVLSNIRASLETIALYSTDRLLGMLPPFHSFGFTVTGLMPILSGIRVAYSPNPTDAKRLASCMEQTGSTIICSAPTFLKNILKVAPSRALKDVRVLVSGAERAPDELFSLVESRVPSASVVEGYGITECSPVLTANISHDRKNGVGKPLPNVRLMIVHPENVHEKKSTGSEGLILASGPNVFSGYLNRDVKSPFLQMDGVRWYNTGDIGFLNEAGALTISGRLKRFVKMGGEMISLASIEAALSEGKDTDTPEYAVIPFGEEQGRPRLILCSTRPHHVFDLNQTLREKGFSNLVKIDSVIVLKELPLLGTGKIAYRELERIAQEKK